MTTFASIMERPEIIQRIAEFAFGEEEATPKNIANVIMHTATSFFRRKERDKWIIERPLSLHRFKQRAMLETASLTPEQRGVLLFVVRVRHRSMALQHYYPSAGDIHTIRLLATLQTNKHHRECSLMPLPVSPDVEEHKLEDLVLTDS